MTCHKIGVAIQIIKIAPLYPLFKIGRNIIIPRKNHKNYFYRFDRGIILIPQSIPNISRCPKTKQPSCIKFPHCIFFSVNLSAVGGLRQNKVSYSYQKHIPPNIFLLLFLPENDPHDKNFLYCRCLAVCKESIA